MISLLKRIYREFLGDFLVVMTMLSLLRAKVQFLFQVESHKLLSSGENKKNIYLIYALTF